MKIMSITVKSSGTPRLVRNISRMTCVAIIWGLMAMLLPAIAFAVPVINTIGVKLPADGSYSGNVIAAVGGTVNVQVNGTSGAGTANNYRSTQWRLSAADSGAFTCLNTADVDNNSTANITFNITVPALTPGASYNLYLIPYSNADGLCTLNAGTQEVLAGAVTIPALDPVAVDDTPSVLEDSGANTIDVLANDTNAGAATISAVSDPANGSTTNNSTDVDYEPDADYCNDGVTTDDFTYTLSPGGDVGNVEVTVTCVNDEPSFTKGANESVNEDAGAQTVVAWATAISAGPANESGQTVSFNVSNDNNALFSAQPAVSSTGTLTYTPAADAFGVANVTINIMDDGGTTNGGDDTSDNQGFTITINAVNDAPSFTAHNDSSAEDAGAQTAVVVGDNFSAGPANESGQSLLACVVSNVSVPGFLLSSGPNVTVSGSECHLAYTAAANANGSFTFDLAVQDDGGTANGGDDTSGTQTVTVTITPVNDPPTVTYLSPASQTSDYSDYIGTVSISVTDIDNASTSLAESNEPPDSVASLSLTATDPACVVDNTLSPNPAEDGSVCSWTYDGQVLDPGDNVYAIDFTPSDGDGANAAGKGTHTLTIEPEDATVKLDGDNDVAVQVDSAGDSPAFSLFFTAWETNNVAPPMPDNVDFAHIGTAADGDFTKALGFMTLSPVGPGDPATGICSEFDSGAGYSEWTTFECAFDNVGVNTYEVLAEVDGSSATTRYYYGMDEDAFVVYDPSLGFTTAGGWFYWPDSAIAEDACLEYDTEEPFGCLVPDPCAGYAGDKTNFGYVMKYNKKGNKVQGSALLQRHTIDPVTCFDAGSYRVKSNALYGLSIGEVPEDHGWAAFAGKATYREPGLENEGNHLFFIYAEDHGEQGCGQDPSDRVWIEVWNKDDVVVMSLGPDAPLDAEDIQCGNIYVPHTPANP